MVDISLIVIVILGISTLFSLYSLVKTGATLGNISSLLLSVVIFFLSISLYLDVMDFREKFETSPKLFLLQEDDKLLAGFSGNLIEETELPDLVTQDDLQQLQQAYDQRRYDAMLGSNYKMFIINLTTFNNMTGDIVLDSDIYTKKYLIDLIHSQTPGDDFVENSLKKENVSTVPSTQYETIKKELLGELQQESPDDAAFRAKLFALLLRQAIAEQGSLFILSQFQQRNIRIHKETMIFTISKHLPKRYLLQLVTTENGETEGNTTQIV